MGSNPAQVLSGTSRICTNSSTHTLDSRSRRWRTLQVQNAKSGSEKVLVHKLWIKRVWGFDHDKLEIDQKGWGKMYHEELGRIVMWGVDRMGHEVCTVVQWLYRYRDGSCETCGCFWEKIDRSWRQMQDFSPILTNSFDMIFYCLSYDCWMQAYNKCSLLLITLAVNNFF